MSIKVHGFFIVSWFWVCWYQRNLTSSGKRLKYYWILAILFKRVFKFKSLNKKSNSFYLLKKINNQKIYSFSLILNQLMMFPGLIFMSTYMHRIKKIKQRLRTKDNVESKDCNWKHVTFQTKTLIFNKKFLLLKYNAMKKWNYCYFLNLWLWKHCN